MVIIIQHKNIMFIGNVDGYEMVIDKKREITSGSEVQAQ